MDGWMDESEEDEDEDEDEDEEEEAEDEEEEAEEERPPTLYTPWLPIARPLTARSILLITITQRFD